MGNIISFDSVLDTSLKMPGVKVDRASYLKEAFSNYGNTDLLATDSPHECFDISILEKVAKAAINKHTLYVTSISTISGIPGGFAMFGTIPADLAQYYYHVLVLAQKLGYIYGWPDLLDENKQVNEGTRHILTMFIGVMMGAEIANNALRKVSVEVSKQVSKRLANQALTKTWYYPIAKKIASWIGIKLTKQSFARGVSKTVPIVGGIVSGGLSLATFKFMSKRLQKELRLQLNVRIEHN